METESLYSFELYVENVLNFNIECFVPSIAFRLLDFPVVQLDLLAHKDIEVLSYKGLTRPDLQNFSAKFRERNGSFIFRKGKSCLFKMEAVTLYKGLSQLPVQIFLFDQSKGSKYLLGTALLPIYNEIQSKVGGLHERNERAALVDFGRKEKLGVYNFMGSKVAAVNVVWNLNDYGNSVTKHLSTDLNHRLSSEILVKTSPKEDGEKSRFFNPKNAEAFNNQCERTENKSSSSRQDIDMRNKRHKKQVNFKVVHSDYEEKKCENSAKTEGELDNKQENETRYICGSPDSANLDLPLLGVIRPPPLVFCSASKESTFYRKETRLKDWEGKIPKHQMPEPSKEDVYHEVLVPSAKRGLFNVKSNRMVEIKHSSCQTEENHHLSPGNNNEVVMKHTPEVPILMALMEDILKFYNASTYQSILNAPASRNDETPSPRNATRKPSPRPQRASAKNVPVKHKSQFHKECISDHDKTVQHANRGKVETRFSAKGKSFVQQKEKGVPYYRTTRAHKLRVEQVKKGSGAKYVVPQSKATEEQSVSSRSTPVKGSQQVWFHKPQTTNEMLLTRTITDNGQQEGATDAKPQWSSPGFEEHNKRMKSGDVVLERLSPQWKQEQAIGVYRSPGHSDLPSLVVDGITSPRCVTSNDPVGVGTKSTFSTVTSGDLDAWSSIDSQSHERASVEYGKTVLQNDAYSNALHNRLPSDTHKQNEIGPECSDIFNNRTDSPDDAYSVDNAEQKDSRASWDDGLVWTDTESEVHVYKEPLPSTYSPEASQSTRRKARPLAERDIDYENEASSVWSSHVVETDHKGNSNGTNASPRSIDIEELYSDDFDDTNEVNTPSASPRKST